MYFELEPAYGRDYTSKAAAIAAFEEGKDWLGDYQLNFQLVSKSDFKPTDRVNLRYKRKTEVASIRVGGRA